MFECQYGRALGRDVPHQMKYRTRSRILNRDKVPETEVHWKQSSRRANVPRLGWVELRQSRRRVRSCQWHAPLHPIPIISLTIPPKGSNPVLAPESGATKYPMLTFRHLALKVDCVNINTSNRLKQDRLFKSALCIDFDDSVASAHLLLWGDRISWNSKRCRFLFGGFQGLLNLGHCTNWPAANLCRPCNYCIAKWLPGDIRSNLCNYFNYFNYCTADTYWTGDKTNKPTAVSKSFTDLLHSHQDLVSKDT